MLAKMDEVVSGKDKMIEEKDKRIGEKDEAITRLEESVDFVTALREIRKTEPGRIWGEHYVAFKFCYAFRHIFRLCYPCSGMEPTEN